MDLVLAPDDLPRAAHMQGASAALSGVSGREGLPLRGQGAGVHGSPRGSASKTAMNSTMPQRFATVFFIACLLLVVYALYLILSPFFIPLLWAGVLTVVFQPLFRETVRVLRGRRTVASIVSCLIVLLIIVLPIFYLAEAVSHHSVALYQILQSSISGTSSEERLNAIGQQPTVRWALGLLGRWRGGEPPHPRDLTEGMIRGVSRFLVALVPTLLRGAGEFVFSFFLMFISMF